MEFYSTERINKYVIVIRSCMGELLYLVEGEKSAVLIDTCVGAGHLKELIETLTAKPYKVLLTHGHVDHAPGSAEFEDVYLNEKDIPLYQAASAAASPRYVKLLLFFKKSSSF